MRMSTRRACHGRVTNVRRERGARLSRNPKRVLVAESDVDCHERSVVVARVRDEQAQACAEKRQAELQLGAAVLSNWRVGARLAHAHVARADVGADLPSIILKASPQAQSIASR